MVVVVVVVVEVVEVVVVVEVVEVPTVEDTKREVHINRSTTRSTDRSIRTWGVNDVTRTREEPGWPNQAPP
ncbi:hypothetical protein V1264_005426 [Littorina saxatilis]|uniref:Secreted protein n=1 Tax=Littorina saxatilis TaxID=31220 RepID=A0AAN9AZG4_9CAEN